ncbi:hypothetical protein T265_06119 [Opisthorchis viverrini]|uniref:RRM domain-containing protein n=1 Tax=Opisthorchis viverrini TaxID=6198 RepID=A0A074ZI93_OPIVI|nr:hypothetical protein T265_06119 [Opisthorchis viverrini]KER26686.1 hypothetical protein T265_06119 [Opisthorchis viverrini]
MQLEQTREVISNRTAVKISDTFSTQSVGVRSTRKTREEAGAKSCEPRVVENDGTRRVCSSTDSGRSSISSSQTSNCEETQDKTSKVTLSDMHTTESMPKTPIQSTKGEEKEVEKEHSEDIDIYADVTLISKSVEPVRVISKIGKQCGKRMQRNKPGKSTKIDKSGSAKAMKTQASTEDKISSVPGNCTHPRDPFTNFQEVSSTTDLETHKAPQPESIFYARNHVKNSDPEKIDSQSERLNEMGVRGAGEGVEGYHQSTFASQSDTTETNQDKLFLAGTTETQHLKRHSSACDLQVTNMDPENPTGESVTSLNTNSKMQSTLTVLIKCKPSNSDAQSVSLSSPNKPSLEDHPPVKCSSKELLTLDLRNTDAIVTSYSTSSSPVPSAHAGYKTSVYNRRRGRAPGSPVVYRGAPNMRSLLSHKLNKSCYLHPVTNSETINKTVLSNEFGQPWKPVHEGGHRSLTSPALLPNPLFPNGSCLCLQPIDSGNLLVNQPMCWWVPGMSWNQYSEAANSLGKNSDFRQMIAVAQPKFTDYQVLGTNTNSGHEQQFTPSGNDAEDAHGRGSTVKVGAYRALTPLIQLFTKGQDASSQPVPVNTGNHQKDALDTTGQQLSADLSLEEASQKVASTRTLFDTQAIHPERNDGLIGELTGKVNDHNCNLPASGDVTSSAAVRSVNCFANLPGIQWNYNANNLIPTQTDTHLVGYGNPVDPCVLSTQFVYFYNTDGQLFAMPSNALFYPTAPLPANNSNSMHNIDSSFSSSSGFMPSTSGDDRYLMNDSKEKVTGEHSNVLFDRMADSGAVQQNFANIPSSWPTIALPIEGPTSNPVMYSTNTGQNSAYRPLLLNTATVPLFFTPPYGTNTAGATNPSSVNGPFSSHLHNVLEVSRKPNTETVADRPEITHKGHYTINETGRLSKGYADSEGLLGHATSAPYAGSNIPTQGDTKLRNSGEESGRISYHSTSTTNRAKKHSSKTNLYIRGLAPTFTEEQLHTLAPDKELIRSVKLIAGTEGEMYGFIDFISNAAARSALLHIKSTNRELYVNFAYESEKDPQNVYITNIPETWTASNVEDLKKIFQQYGPIATAIVMTKRSNNFCTGAGFVRFVRAEDAQKAIEGIRQAQVTLDGGKGPLEVKLADRQKPQEEQANLTKARPQKPVNDGSSAYGQESRSEHSQESHHRQQSNPMNQRNASCLLPGESVPPLIGPVTNANRSVHGAMGMGLLSTPNQTNSASLSARLPNPNSITMAIQAALASNAFINQTMFMHNQLNPLNFQVALGPDNSPVTQTGLLSYPAPPLPGLFSQTRGGPRNVPAITNTPGVIQSHQNNSGMFPTPASLIPILRTVDDVPFPAASINISGTPHNNVLSHAMHPPNSWGASPLIPGLFASM